LVCYDEIFGIVHPSIASFVPSESSLQGGVHELCFVAFQLMEEKNIEV